MTKYEKVADEMVKDIDGIITLIADNNGKIPTKLLGVTYGIDGTAAREILIGILAVRKIKES